MHHDIRTLSCILASRVITCEGMHCLAECLGSAVRACGGRGGGHHALLGALCSRSLAAVRLPYPPGRPCMYHVAPQCPPITRLVSRGTKVPDHRNRLNCATRHMRPAATRLALIMSGLAHSTSLLSQRPTQAAHRLDRAQARGPSWRLLAVVWGRNGRSDPVGCGLPATAALLWPACRDLCLSLASPVALAALFTMLWSAFEWIVGAWLRGSSSEACV